MSENKKICPLLASEYLFDVDGKPNKGNECVKERCAWWVIPDEKHGECALAWIAVATTTTAIQSVLK